MRIVAIGASNTHGWYVGNAGAYPAQLQALLRAKQIDAQVTNAGVPFDTTAMMLRRLDREVPDGTEIVILQPGANDRRFLGTASSALPISRRWSAGCGRAESRWSCTTTKFRCATTPSISSI